MTLRFADGNQLPGGILPDFDAPPVAEVSLNLQVANLPAYHTLHAANFWRLVQDRFPRVEEQPPLDAALETFGAGSGANFRFEMMQAPPQPRFYFVSSDNNELLQLQKDRFGYNWRKSSPDAKYPRYPYVREQFSTYLDLYLRWLAQENLGQPAPIHCEVVYVNQIPLFDGGGQPCGLSHVLPSLSDLEGTTEDGTLQFRRQLFNETGDLVGRMYFVMSYGTDEAGNRNSQMLLRVRGRPNQPTYGSCLAFLDSGRELIVTTFANMTSSAAHKLWERRQ